MLLEAEQKGPLAHALGHGQPLMRPCPPLTPTLSNCRRRRGNCMIPRAMVSVDTQAKAVWPMGACPFCCALELLLAVMRARVCLFLVSRPPHLGFPL